MVAFVLLRVFVIFTPGGRPNAFFAAAEFALREVRDTRIQQLIEARRSARALCKNSTAIWMNWSTASSWGHSRQFDLGWVGEPILARMVEGPASSNSPRTSLRSRNRHRRRLHSDYLPARDLRGTGTKSPRSSKGRTGGAGCGRAHGDFPYPDEAFYLCHEPGCWSVLRIFGGRKMRQGPVHSPDELKLIVTASRQLGQIPPLQEEMIHHALELDDVAVRAVMVPRPDIFSLPSNLTLDEALPAWWKNSIRESPFTTTSVARNILLAFSMLKT